MYRIHSNVKTGRKRGFSYRKLQKELQVKMPAFIRPRSDAEVHRNLPFQKPVQSKSRITILSIKYNKVSSYKKISSNVKTGRKPEASSPVVPASTPESTPSLQKSETTLSSKNLTKEK
jgi:hypothetical protein